jgi:ribosomal-protein-alanine N-acetyltransferase
MKKLLIIRLATEADLEKILLFELCNRRWFSQFLPEKILCKQTEEYFKYLLKGKFKHLQYVVLLPSGELVGRFSGQLLDTKRQTLEVSYRIAKDFSNQGIARYVLKRLLIVWASYGIHEVYAQVSDHNSASMKVLMSCGFQMSELQKGGINFESTIHDSLIFKWTSADDVSYQMPMKTLHEVLTN